MMNLPVLFPSFMIFVHYSIRRVACDMEFKSLKKAIEGDNIQIVEKFLNGENRQQVLHEAVIEEVQNTRLKELMGPREYSYVRLPGNGALHWAVIKRAPKVTRLLLENGANVNMLTSEGQTPLSLAAATHYVHLDPLFEKGSYDEVVDTLLQFRADIHMRDDLGFTPLSYAVVYRNVLLVKKLLAHGGNINEKCGTGLGKTPLHRAVEDGCVEMTKFLLDNKAECDAGGRYGENVFHIIFSTGRAIGKKDRAAIAKLLLRSENAENIMKQRENRHQKTPLDIFFEQSDPNREILVDLLKVLHNLDDAYGVSALRTFNPSLEQNSSTWPLDSFPKYVKIAMDSYLEILFKRNSRWTFALKENSRWTYTLNACSEFFCSFSGISPVSPIYDVKYFMKKSLYSLYVILRTHFQIRRGQDREEAAKEVDNFEGYLRELGLPFQNALCYLLAKGTTLDEILPNDILRKIFHQSDYGPYIERMAKIMSLVQFTRTQRWSVDEMTDTAPAFTNYVERKDILLF